MHGRRDADNERKDGHDDECPERTGIHQLGQTSHQLTLYRTSDFLPLSNQVLNATGGGIWRFMGPTGPFGVIQNPHALVRSSR